MSDVVPHCPVHPDVPLEPRRRGWTCPACERRVLTYRQWPRAETHLEVAADQGDPVLERLPWLIAPRLAVARDLTQPPAARLDHALEAAFGAIRLAALLLLAAARQAGKADHELAGALGRLTLPGWRSWVLLGDHLGGEGGLLAGDAWSAGLGTAWRQLAAAGGVLARLLEVTTAPAVVRDADGEPDASWLRTAADAEQVVATLFGPDTPRLLRVVEGGEPCRVISLHGIHADLLFKVEASEAVPARHGAGTVFAVLGDVTIPLEPFLLASEMMTVVRPGVLQGDPAVALLLPTADGAHYQGCGAPTWRAMDWGHLATWLSESGGLEPDPVRRQQVAVPAAIRASRAIERLRRLPWHAGSFLSRPGLEESFAAALRRPGHAVLVVGEAGAGKTVLLARLAAHLLGEAQDDELSPALSALATNPPGDPDVVALVSGPGAWRAEAGDTGARILVSAVAAALGIRDPRQERLDDLLAGLAESGADDRRLGRKVWLLLDGPDESEHGEAILAALDSALGCLASYPWLRLAVTLDVRTWRGGVGSSGQRRVCFENVRALYDFADPRSDRRRPFLEVPGLDPERELPAWFEHRQRVDPARASPVPFALLPDQLRNGLHSPLQVQLFHESGRWFAEPAPADDAQRRMIGFLLRRSESEGWSLSDLAAALVRARAPGVPLTWIWEQWQAWAGVSGAGGPTVAAGPSPIERLISNGLVQVPERMSWPPDQADLLLFAHPLMAESLICWELLRRLPPGDQPGAGDLLDGLELAPGRWSLRSELAGALADLAARLVEADTVARLDILLTGGDAELAAQALAGALAAAFAGAAKNACLERWLAATRGSPEVARRLNHAFILAGLPRPLDAAAASFRIEVRQALVAHVPDEPGRHQALVSALAARAVREADPAAVLRDLRAAREHLATLRRRWPARPGLAELSAAVLPWLGEAAATLGHTGEAEVVLRAALPIVRARVAGDPSGGRAERCLAMTLVTLADLALSAARPVEGEHRLEEAAALVARLRASEPSDREVQRLWGRVALVAGRLAQAQHRLNHAWELLEEATARLRPLVRPPRHGWAALDFGLAVMRFADLAGEEKRHAMARTVLEDGVQVLAPPVCDPGDPALALVGAELCWRLAGLAYHADEERDLVLRCVRLLQPRAGDADAPPRWAVLWRSVNDAVRERGWAEPEGPET
ncbi:MAG TPA: hypothetical protein PLS53_00640 [Thermoanaerobaculaceae bacterium]|nr:hypothetical protein [Thermoanaerobaculaceae bacterium]HPS76642.1 hypothetical protein [Thermoanaerobaculaceae bacterium]